MQNQERGCLVTVITCSRPAGHYMLPLIIFPRKNMKLELMYGTPREFRGFSLHTGSTISSSTWNLLKKILPYSDWHYSHTTDWDVINLGIEHHVSVISLLLHSMHKMHPLDLSFMSPLKTFCMPETEQWIQRSDGRVVTIYHPAKLFGRADLTVPTAHSEDYGFQIAALFSCNRNIFWPHNFLSDETSFNKNSVSLTMNQDWPGTFKEFDPLPISAQIMIPTPEADISPWPSVTSKTRSTNSLSVDMFLPRRKRLTAKGGGGFWSGFGGLGVVCCL